VRDRHGGVVLNEKERHRLAHDVASADDDGPRAAKGDALALEQLEDPGGRAGHGRWLALQEPPGIDGMESVRVLPGVDRLEDPGRADVFREGELNQDRVHRVVVVEEVHGGEDLALRQAGGKAKGALGDPGFTRRGALTRDIDRARRMLAHEDDREARHDPARRELRHAIGHFGPNRARDARPVQNRTRHSFYSEGSARYACLTGRGRGRIFHGPAG